MVQHGKENILVAGLICLVTGAFLSVGGIYSMGATIGVGGVVLFVLGMSMKSQRTMSPEEIEDIEIKALYDKNEYLNWPPFNEADIEIYPTLLEVNIIFNEGNFKKIFFISGDDVVG